MTIRESLASLNTYPIPSNFLDLVCLERDLTGTDTMTSIIAQSEVFQLAKADVYMFLYGAPSLSEQEVGISVVERSNYFDLAQQIYAQYGDAKGQKGSFGFNGEDFNA